MQTHPAPAVFFDIGGTLAAPRLSAPPPRLLGLAVYPYVPAVLARLRNQGARVGVISSTGDMTADEMQAILQDAGLLTWLDPALLVYTSVVGLEKDSPAIFRLAAGLAGHATDPSACLFVGDDSGERSQASAAGLRVAPHPLLAADVLDGRHLRYVRIDGPTACNEEIGMVPLQVVGADRSTIYAIASDAAVPLLAAGGLSVQALGEDDEPLATDLYVVRDYPSDNGHGSEAAATALLANWGSEGSVLTSSEHGVYIALPAERAVDELHVAGMGHGHTLKLVPDLTLLTRPGESVDVRVARAGWTRPDAAAFAEARTSEICAITGSTIRSYLDRYTGVQPVEPTSDVRIVSRHIRHADNARATQAMAHAFEEIEHGRLQVRLHPFSHRSRTLHNVEAELPGQAPGELVLVTAHLDSTAAFGDGPYDPTTMPAPGSDDDCSGVAAVLSIAEALTKLATRTSPPKRAIRFVLFNAEEDGLVGSKAYARDEAANSAPIVAVFQMDMIGYNVKPPRSYEIHAGYLFSQPVEEKSLTIARIVEQMSEAISPGLQRPQVYGKNDPAFDRSDHASFQARGYAACAVTEDFFHGPVPASPAEEPNPNYHKPTDTFVDAEYAADIARVVASAAWHIANA